MSKEEILSKNGDSYFIPEVLQSMDEYAKEQAIDFGNWLAEKEWNMLYATSVWESVNYTFQLSTEKLYQLFVEEQNKQ